jgi:hypothetical protein
VKVDAALASEHAHGGLTAQGYAIDTGRLLVEIRQMQLRDVSVPVYVRPKVLQMRRLAIGFRGLARLRHGRINAAVRQGLRQHIDLVALRAVIETQLQDLASLPVQRELRPAGQQQGAAIAGPGAQVMRAQLVTHAIRHILQVSAAFLRRPDGDGARLDADAPALPGDMGDRTLVHGLRQPSGGHHALGRAGGRGRFARAAASRQRQCQRQCNQSPSRVARGRRCFSPCHDVSLQVVFLKG